MDGQKAAGSMFMCQLCNLFSPSHSQLLAHCSQLHPEQEPPDHIIRVLQPLQVEPVEKQADGPVKRKRGRPKGCTKKTPTNSTDGKTDSANTLVDGFEGEKRNNVEGDQQCSPGEGKSWDGISKLECKSCRRLFSNRRQILKHICKRRDDEDEDEEDESTGGGAGGVASQIQGSGGADSNQTKPNSKSGYTRKKVDGGQRRGPRIKRSCNSKEARKATETKKTVVNVVLTEDKSLPGVSKMVPVEDSSAETESAAQHSAVPTNESQDLPSEASACEGNNKTHQEPSSNSAGTTTTSSKGFQEYSIKQDANNLPPSQLKIFACEFCNKIFKFRHSLVAHLRTHTQEKPFQCPHCEYASAIKANLNVHLRKHTGEKFSCDQCPFNCLSPGHLKVHIERVHMKVKQHCSFCEKKYSDVKNLLKHMELHHDLKDPTVHQNYQQLRLKTRQGLRQLLYHCPTCNRHFKNQLVRERHMFIHGPQRPFACLLCDHAATNMPALATHVRKHLFMYVCCVCDGKFVSSQRLKGHLTESHPELDQEQAFTDSINCSCHLNQEGGGTEETEATGREVPREGEEEEASVKGERRREGRKEERARGGEQVEDGSQEESVKEEEPEGATGKEHFEKEGDRMRDEATRDPPMSSCMSACKEDTHASSTPASTHTPALEETTVENMHTAAEKTLTAENNQTAEGSRSSSGGPMDGSSNTHSGKESDVAPPSAFQLVFSSLQKTPLNIETFQRLRKIYGDLECQYCGKLFWYRVHYNVHVRTHTKEHLHYCSKCNYSSITKNSLQRHQIQKHSGLMLSCSYQECKYTTPDKYKLQAHHRTHNEKGRSTTCPICQKSYSKHRLKNHIKRAHPDTLPAHGRGLMVQRAEKCPYCDSYFLKNSSDFQQHIWAHQGLKPYACNLCNYAGRSRSNLKTHMNRHNTERRHLCDLCGKKFKSKFTLKSHRLSHTDEGKRFQCSECDYTSVYKPSLLRHMEQHAEFKPFRCAHCHYSCNVAGALKRHYNLKHPDQTYENARPGPSDPEVLKQQGGMKCPECDFVYGTKWELNRHLKSKHCLKAVDVWEMGEEVEAQYVTVEDQDHLTEAPLSTLQDTVNIQQITEFSSETQEAVTSMVAMAPGTVTVVQQVAEEQEVNTCTNQLMVLDADGALSADQVMVVEEAGLEALTVLTQGDDAHHYIVYVQEHTVEIN